MSTDATDAVRTLQGSADPAPEPRYPGAGDAPERPKRRTVWDQLVELCDRLLREPWPNIK